MRGFILFILKFLLFIYLLIGILLYIFQRDLLYFPSPKKEYAYSKMLLEYEGETLNTIVLNRGKKEAIIYFGGNAEAVVSNSEIFLKTFPNYTIYLVDYAGYGWSSGKPSKERLFKNAIFIYDHIKNEHQSISLIGRSLGSGVASYLASKREVKKLALITPFDSLKNVAQKMYPIYPIGLILKDNYDSVEYLKERKTEDILILMAKDDRVIPNVHSYNLAKSLPEDEVQVEVIEHVGHNNISNVQEFYEILELFMDSKN